MGRSRVGFTVTQVKESRRLVNRISLGYKRKKERGEGEGVVTFVWRSGANCQDVTKLVRSYRVKYGFLRLGVYLKEQ